MGGPHPSDAYMGPIVIGIVFITICIMCIVFARANASKNDYEETVIEETIEHDALI